jgi:prephenate dehydratase
MKIAYQGEPGAFSEAASRQVNASADLVPCKTFEDVFAVVNSGAADYGVLPIENSIGGSIHRNFDLLLENQLPIVGEVEVPVVHHLLALPGRTLADIRRVYSHPQALAQCDRFLRTLSGVEITATYDTAGSAKMIADQRLGDAAAIASARAGEVFGLQPVLSSIQDYDSNTTRFLVVGKHPLSDAAPCSRHWRRLRSAGLISPNSSRGPFRAANGNTSSTSTSRRHATISRARVLWLTSANLRRWCEYSGLIEVRSR